MTPVSEFLERVGVSSSSFCLPRNPVVIPSLCELTPELRMVAGRLAYGERSKPVLVDGHTVLLRRMPRDFKIEAARLVACGAVVQIDALML